MRNEKVVKIVLKKIYLKQLNDELWELVWYDTETPEGKSIEMPISDRTFRNSGLKIYQPSDMHREILGDAIGSLIQMSKQELEEWSKKWGIEIDYERR